MTLVVLTSFGITLYMINEQRSSHYNNMVISGSNIAGIIAQNSEYGVFTEDLETLVKLADSAFGNPDVVYVRLIGQNGKVILEKHRPGFEGEVPDK